MKLIKLTEMMLFGKDKPIYINPELIGKARETSNMTQLYLTNRMGAILVREKVAEISSLIESSLD